MGNCCASENIYVAPQNDIHSRTISTASRPIKNLIKPKAMQNFKRQIDINNGTRHTELKASIEEINVYSSTPVYYNEQVELDAEDSDSDLSTFLDECGIQEIKNVISTTCPF